MINGEKKTCNFTKKAPAVHKLTIKKLDLKLCYNEKDLSFLNREDILETP